MDDYILVKDLKAFIDGRRASLNKALMKVVTLEDELPIDGRIEEVHLMKQFITELKKTSSQGGNKN